MGSKTKTNLKDKLDGNELDLSLCDYTKVPVKEIVSFENFNGQVIPALSQASLVVK